MEQNPAIDRVPGKKIDFDKFIGMGRRALNG